MMNKADKDTQIAQEPAEEVVGTAEALENLIKRVKRAQKEFATFSQTQVNAIFKADSAGQNGGGRYRNGNCRRQNHQEPFCCRIYLQQIQK